MSLNIIDTIYNFIDNLKKNGRIENITEKIENYTIYNKQFKDEKNKIEFSGKIKYNYLGIEYTFILIQTEELIQEEDIKIEKIGYIFLDNIIEKVINEQNKQIGNSLNKKYCIFIHDIYNKRYKKICPELSFIQNKDFCFLPNTEKCNKLKGIISLIGNFLLKNDIYTFNGDIIVQDNSQKSFKKIDTNIIIKKEDIKKLKEFKEYIDKNINDTEYLDKIVYYIFMNDIFEKSKYYFYIITHYNIDELKNEDINFIEYFNEDLPEIYTDDNKIKYQEIQNVIGQVYTIYYIDLWLYKRLINDFIDIDIDKNLNDILTLICEKDNIKNENEGKYLFNKNTKSTYSSFNIYFIEKKDAIIFNYIIEQIKIQFEKDIEQLKKIMGITNDNIIEVNDIFNKIINYTINSDTLIEKFGEDYKTYLEEKYNIKTNTKIKCRELLLQINNYLKSYDINNFICKLQTGGKNYYNKYIKYKLKYLNLKNKI